MDSATSDHEIITRQTLLEVMGRRSLERAVATGDLVVIDRSRFAVRGTQQSIITAARARGTLTCLSALRQHGVWTLDDRLVHLSRTRGMRNRYRLPPGGCDCRGWVSGGSGMVDGLDAALSAVQACHDREHGIVALDSIIRHRLLTTDELERLTVAGGAPAMQLLARADGCVESALESALRHRLAPRPGVPQHVDTGWSWSV